MLSLDHPELLKTQAYIHGKWVDSDTAETTAVINPFSQATLATVPNLTAKQIELAIVAAHTAQADWASQTAEQRGKVLDKWAALIDRHTDDLARILTAEQGKPLNEARGEIGYANRFIRWFAEEGKRVYGDVIPPTQPNLRYVVLKQPIGVCAAITPWNFPAAMITRKVAPALAAGCSMIVKPATETPLTALALAELAAQAGLPAGVLQVVTGDAVMIGKQLCQDERIRKLSFTGSTDVGRILMAQSAPTLKKLSLELGGNAPFIVFEDADIDNAVDGLMASKFRNAGQTCVCANRIYLHRAIKDRFISRLTAKVNALTVGNGMTDGVEIGALINQAAIDKTQQLIDDALAKGATLVTGGHPHPASSLCFEPTIITDMTPAMALAQAEIFAPIVPVFVFDEEAEVIAAANRTPYGLAAYFYTQSLSRSWRVTEALEFGMVAQNTGLLSNEVAPFGGVKQSGFGREGSKYGIEEYITTKYWCVAI